MSLASKCKYILNCVLFSIHIFREKEMKHEQKPKGRDHDIKMPPTKDKILSAFNFF